MNINQAISNGTDQIAQGAKLVVDIKTDSGLLVTVQRSNHNNCRQARVVVQVRRNGKLLRKNEWMALS